MRALLTAELFATLVRARDQGVAQLACSIDLGRSTQQVLLHKDCWQAGDNSFPYWLEARQRTLYHWAGREFQPAARFTGSFIKLVPTHWGAPTFEIDGIKMLPSEKVSPYLDAESKVALVEPHGKAILDSCGGLGYFAAHALAQNAKSIVSFEKNADVLWLRSLNPWSPADDDRLQVHLADVAGRITDLPSAAFDAIMHDAPRISIAGELYTRGFYQHLARIIRPGGRLFHYTGAPHRASHGRDLAQEVVKRLRSAGFRAEKALDGVLAVRQASRSR